MNPRFPILIVGLLLVAASLGFVPVDRGSPVRESEDRDLSNALARVTRALEVKPAGGVKQQVAAIAAKIDDVDDVMHLFALRGKHGLGVGAIPGAIRPDGIEAMVQRLAKKPLQPAQADQQAEALREMAYTIVAVAMVAEAKPPPGPRNDWLKWSRELRTNALQLATAARQKNPQEIKQAAVKIDQTCTTCHEKFR